MLRVVFLIDLVPIFSRNRSSQGKFTFNKLVIKTFSSFFFQGSVNNSSHLLHGVEQYIVWSGGDGGDGADLGEIYLLLSVVPGEGKTENLSQHGSEDSAFCAITAVEVS